MKLPAVLFLLLAASAAQAHDIRQHAPHVHGQATVDVALDQQTLEFALQAPGIGILDYERPPANAAEQAALARATSLLKGGNWVTCPPLQSAVWPPVKPMQGFDATSPRRRRDSTGTQVSAQRCSTTVPNLPSCGRSSRLPVLFPGLHEVIVNSATANGQNRSVLTPDNLRVVLAP